MEQENPLQWLICSGYTRMDYTIMGDPVPKAHFTPCNKKLLKHNINDGLVEIKCHKCHTTNIYETT